MIITQQDRSRISAAIHDAETKTSGEIVCVLAHASADPKALPIFIAAVAALAVPWLLVALTSMSVQRILILQILTFAALCALFCLPRVRVALTPRSARQAIAHRAAMEQFIVRGLAHKNDGILIFVSLAERYARIIAADGIAARVPHAHWQKAVGALVSYVCKGQVADGFVTAIGMCGDVLAEHFPRTEQGSSKLPDRVYVI